MNTDVAKVANALSRPGIDPRKFVDVGVVSAVSVTSEGVHVDIETPENVTETAQLAPPYAGPGYGLHLPIDLDDAVVLAVPDGKWNAGARVVGRTWDAGCPPPLDVIDNPDDVVLVVKPRQSLRIIVTGGGQALISVGDGHDINIEVSSGGTVHIGGGGVESPPMKVTDGNQFMIALQTAITALVAAPIPAAALIALQTALQAIEWPQGATSVTVR